MPISGPPWVVSIAGISQYLQHDAGMIDYVVSGLELPLAGGLQTALASGVAYVSGLRVQLLTPPISLAASSDNYIDLTRQGVVVVTPVALAAAAPAIPPNAMRLGFVKSGASTITSATQTGKDSLGNWMRNTAPRQITSCANYSSGQAVSSPGDNFVQFNGAASELYDNAYGHSPSTNTSFFYAQAAGLYTFSCWVDLASGGAGADFLDVYKNGVSLEVGYVSGALGATHQLTLSIAAAIPLVAGDYLQARYTMGGGSTSISRAAASLIRVG